MLKKVFIMPLVFLSVCLVFSPGCKTSEESATTWDPSGVWNFSFTLTITLNGETTKDNLNYIGGTGHLGSQW